MQLLIIRFILFLIFSINQVGYAASFFFPDIHPTIQVRKTPEWLKDSFGNDGYLTITSEVIPATSCVSLSEKSFWKSEKTQLLISVSTRGFHRQAKEIEIPIATFDGRTSGNECASLSTLPLQLVSNALLEPFSSVNPGNLALTVHVKTATDSTNDIVGSAQFLLGAAAIVATGGISTAITGATSIVGNPVLSDVQKRTAEMLKGTLNGKIPMSFGWPEIRNGIEVIEIPVYRAEGSLGNTPDKKIQQLQMDPLAEKTKLLTVKLTFTYKKTLFDPSASQQNDLPNREGISRVNVLNHMSLNGSMNFLQVLNDKSPSLLQMMANAEGSVLTNACSIGFEKLKHAGLNYLDTAIVMKSFIDEAKRGNDWYTKPSIVNSCFSQAPNVQAFLPKVYGNAQPQFIFGDVQDGLGSRYQSWRDIIGPIMSDFRQNLLAKENALQLLIQFNHGQDIDLQFAPDIDPWALIDSSEKPLPGIRTLLESQISRLGCFIYKDITNLQSNSLGTYAVLQSSDQQQWLGFFQFSNDQPRRIARIKIAQLSPDWKAFYQSLQFPGGECPQLIRLF